MSQDLSTWLPLGLYLLAILAFVVAVLVLAHLIAPPQHRPVKDLPYESGMQPLGDARQRFDIRYYLVAILFLLFDVELLFLYPWAVAAYAEDGLPPALRDAALLSVLVFLGLLLIGYLYEWAKGGFRWR
ncbi:MAG: NADH-quinone oxidoreductase subunit A [Gemmatales bacterium]|nr:NADH-quinone oxidoreductase subunit A [Gemmatales bacterium]MCS7161062.1 NADH-quinone oxidoreductase subunit A [Gemmatales bacterium]MDW8176265.1 NADH-quinone oxidoreductase subunit A [Gemmatales bacterium]MDW8223121.1 NADH-quinone oxidoreductase subunit A [Gemmatales bacterium]